MDEAITAAAQAAAGALKKIRAGKGKLVGYFYYVGDTRGKQAALVVTLQARDKKGTKASSEGKKLRKLIPGAKFSRGTVSVDGSKLIFELRAGSASGGHVKSGFKKSGLADVSGLGVLKKAVIRKGGVDEADDDEQGSTAAEAAAPDSTVEETFDDIDPAELAALLADQEELGELTDEVDSFLAGDDVQAEIGEQIAEQLTALSALEAAEPRDDKAIAAARRALAELAYTGPNPFPEVGQPLDPETRAILSGAVESAVKALDAFLDKAIAEIKLIHDRLQGMSDEERAALTDSERKAMIQSLDLSADSVTSYRDQLRKNLTVEAHG